MRGKLGVILIFVMTAVLFVYAQLAARSFNGSLYMWGQAAGTLGIMGIAMSAILSARHPFVDRLFGGLDSVYKWHHVIGGVAFILVLNHPLLFVVSSLPTNMLSYYLLPSSSLPNTLGVIALYGLLLLIFLTLFVDLPYRLWKKTHEWMGGVLLVASAHFVLVPSSLMSSLPLKGWLIIWSFIALVAYLYKRFLYYTLSPHAQYTVVQTTMRDDTVVVALRRISPTPLTVYPGQFVFVHFGTSRDEHPFSVVSYTDDELVLGYKIVGPFTLAFSQLPQGAHVTVRGSYGTFGDKARKQKNMIWIAGGIGITPFLSMAHALQNDQKATLIYVTHDTTPNPLDPLLASAHTTPGLTIYRHVSTQSGRLTGDTICRALPHDHTTYFFLCGPVAMMESITSQLVSIGIHRKKIIYEDFAFK